MLYIRMSIHINYIVYTLHADKFVYKIKMYMHKYKQALQNKLHCTLQDKDYFL